MSKHPKSLKISDYPVELISVGRHTLGQVRINDDVAVIFRMKQDDPEMPDINANCLTCKISNISKCADLVCPDIKANDPNASCADAIRECIELACRNSCRSTGIGGSDILVIA